MADALPEAEGGLGEGVHPENLVDYLDLSMSAGPDGAQRGPAVSATLPPTNLAAWPAGPWRSTRSCWSAFVERQTTVRAAPSTTRPVATSGAADVAWR